MSVGHLTVELTLEDGQYQAKMRQAGQSAQTLSGHLNTLNRSTTGLQGGLSGTIPHLRDIAIITSSLHSIVSGVADTFGELAKSLVRANSEIEKSTVLLSGLSKAVGAEGKMAEANRDLNFLFETAKQAPFALKELTNSFVKMKAVGLDDVDNKLKSLTDAIANFGGSDEGLHRSTVAIQQMASKGVISMEELRQQLGESLPNAMQMMADGMGMSMSKLIKNVSEGKVKAVPAIEAMLQEMEFSMQGASKRMMETWSGMISQLSTNWMLLQKQIGDAGGWSAAKDGLKELNTFLQSDEALKYGQSLGDGMKVGIEGVVSLTKELHANREELLRIGEGILGFWAVTKALAPAQAIVMGLLGVLGPTGTAMGLLTSTTKMWSAALATSTVQSTYARYGMAGMGLQATQTTVAIGTLARTTAIASATFTTLLGPIGMIGAAIIWAGHEYYEFANKGVKALDEVIAKQKELNDAKTVRVDGDAALKTREDLDQSKNTINELEIRKQALMASNKGISEDGGGIFTYGLTLVAEKNAKQIKEIQDKQDIAARASAEGNAELFDRLSKRSTATEKAALAERAALRIDDYKRQRDAISENLELMTSAKRSQVDKEKYLQTALSELQKSEVDGRIALAEKEVASLLEIRSRLMESSNESIPMFISLQINKSTLESDKATIMAEIAVIKTNIEEATKNGTDTKVLTDALKAKEAALKGVGEKLLEVYNNLKAIKSSGAILDKDIENIATMTGGLSELNDELARLRKGKLSPEDMLMGDNEGKELKQLASEWESAQKSLAGYADDYLKLNSKTFSKSAIGMGEDLPKMNKAFADVINDQSESADSRRIAETARVFTNSEFGDGKTDVKGENKTSARLKEEILLMRTAADELRSEGKTREEINQLKDQSLDITHKLSIAEHNLKNAGTDLASDESIKTIKLKRLLDEAAKVGRPTDGINEALLISKQNDANASKLKGVEKTAAESLRINNKMIADIIKGEDFVLDVERKSNQSKVDSELKLNGTKEQLYANDTRAFVENLHDQLIQHEISTEAQVKTVISSQLKIREEKRKTDEALRIKVSDNDILNVQQKGSASRAGGTPYDRDKIALEVNYAQAVKATTEKIREEGKSENELSSLLRNLYKQREEDYKDLEYAHRTSFEKMAQDTVDFRQVAGDAATQFTTGMIDGFAQLATNGTQSFKQFTKSVLQGIAQMLIKMALLKAFEVGMGMFSAGGVMSSSGATNAAADSTSTLSSGLANFNADAVKGIKISSHAMGGVMTSMGDIPLKAYAGGGVANSPQMSLFGEGRTPEAYVPLPDGRSIPVTMKGGAGGGDTVTIQINVDNKGNSTDKKATNQGPTNGDMWEKMADGIKSVVVQTIVEQKRPGGQLYGR